MASPATSNDASLLVEAFVDYVLNLLPLILPDPLPMNKSPKGLINVENAKIYGLSHINRSCPVTLNVYSTPTDHHVNTILCIDLKDNLKIDALFKLSTMLYDSDLKPGILHLFNFTMSLNLTLNLPRTYNETSEALFQLDGIPTVEMSKLEFLPPQNESNQGLFGFLMDFTSFISSGPLGGYIEKKIGEAIQKAIKQTNQKMQKSVKKFINRGR